MIGFGTSDPLPVMRSIRDGTMKIDRADMPRLSFFTARDGILLAYRMYPAFTRAEDVDAPQPSAAPSVVAVLLHRASARSRSMHALGRALSQGGVAELSLDIRGHWDSGVHGDIAYIGQLEDDMEDFLAQAKKNHPDAKFVLIGHGAGGGLALRIAGGKLGGLFDRYVLLAPFLSYNSASQRPESGGWLSVSTPRLLVLRLLDRMHLHWFEGLQVVSFAIDQADHGILVPSYSYRFMKNMQPHAGYLGDVRRSPALVLVIAGQKDETFFAEGFAAALSSVLSKVQVRVLPGGDHMGMVTQRATLDEVLAMTLQLRGVETQPAQ
ncbi:MAG: alpha/beta hydrolase [Candidatus Protistobacter heckmanni]|nr:alpha/beta hydrolase [Candidatus Protistobacter heckmanni]